MLSSDQNTLDGTPSQHSQHSTSQDDMADIEEGTQCPAAVQLADAQVCVLTSCSDQRSLPQVLGRWLDVSLFLLYLFERDVK